MSNYQSHPYEPLGFPALIRLYRVELFEIAAHRLRSDANRYAANNEISIRQLRMARKNEDEARRLRSSK